MAQHVEPMDIDSSVCDFDDKENALHHFNAHPRTPCTEKGYEELDVSELNMKLRYSVTPAGSPMSKSYAGNFENRNFETDNTLDAVNGNMTRSLHTTLTKNDSFNKTQKVLPLQNLPTDSQIGDNNRNVLQPLDSTLIVDKNITITVSATNDDENISLPSSSSSMTHTPEATTPTKEIPKIDGGSPIIRGLKSVLNMFRPSQSPIPGEEDIAKLETLSPPIVHSPDNSQDTKDQAVTASTPLVGHKTKDLIKRNNSNRDSIVFNEDLEKDLEWNDDSTILFSNEKIPIHKLFFQQPKPSEQKKTLDETKTIDDELENQAEGDNINATLEYMDISYNDSVVMDKTATRIPSDLNKSEITNAESDSEFVDCESNYSKNESFKSHDGNELNSTEDVLSHINDIVDATNISVDTLNASDTKSANLSTASTNTTKAFNISNETHFRQEINKENDNIVSEEIKKVDPLQDTEAKYETNVEELKLVKTNEASPVSHLNTTHVIDSVSNDIAKTNSFIENNSTNISNVDNIPLVDNVGVKSLSQIPLIVDPRVLLFNIPSVSDADKTNGEIEIELYTSPADIPLPEDDDLPSLPVMNSELETLSNALDKIAEEIPKINQHESSVSSVDLSDNKSVENASEIHIPSEVRENSISEVLEIQDEGSENVDPHTVDDLKQSEVLANQNDNKFDNITEVNNTVPAVLPISAENQQETRNMTLSAEISKEINEVISIHQSKTPEDMIIPIESQSELDIVPDINSGVESSSLKKEIKLEVEPMNISITEAQITRDADNMQVTSEEMSNVKSSNNELKTLSDNVSPENIVNAENVLNNDKIETPFQGNQCAFSIVSDTESEYDKSNTQMIESNIEFLKQEVEAIVSKAINIVEEKAKTQSNKIIDENSEAIENGIQNKNTILGGSNTETSNLTSESNSKQNVMKDLETVQDHTDQSKFKSIDNLSSQSTKTHEEDVTIQQITLNELSNNGYDHAVQDNIPVVTKDNILVENYNVISTDSSTEERKSVSENNTVESNRTDSEIEKPDIITDNIMDVIPDNNLVSNSKATEQNKIECQPAVINKIANFEDVTPSEMEKTDRTAATDDEIILSENNSPFVLVSQELEDVSIKTTNENFENTVDPFATKSEIVKTPPSSPKIVSKGYNFNFDEIDDPFATKTKIRVSPVRDAVPNQTFEQINIEQEPPKKDVNRNNRRKSQPDKRRSAVNNKRLNSTFSGKSSHEVKSKVTAAEFVSPQVKSEPSNLKLTKESSKDTQSLDNTKDIMNDSINGENIVKEHIANVPAEKVSDEKKETSSSEQSTYFSAGTSSDEIIEAKTEISIPTLDDPNFNPFATKSKIRLSPPPEVISPFVTRSRICQTPPQDFNDEDPFATKSKIKASPETSFISDTNQISSETNYNVSEANSEIPTQTLPNDNNKNEIEHTTANLTLDTENSQNIDKNNGKLDYPEEKESSDNSSGTTCSSNNDKDNTAREVNTEDEDTIEGPFLEPEDFQNDDKMCEYDGDNADMIQFSDLPPENEENPDAGELFIDAEAFEFLLNQNKANTVTDSGKESLFLKFDPLFANRVSSDGVMAALKQIQTQTKQSTPIKDKKPSIPRDATFDKSPLAKPIPRDATFDKSSSSGPIPRDASFDKSSPAGPSGLNTTQEMDMNSTAEESYDDLNVTVSKPMMVVNPAVNPVVTPRNKTITPSRSNRQSLTFTSPAIAVIDRLLSMSAGNNSLMAHETSIAEVHRDNEADLALTQLRELLADKEINVYSLRSETKELQNRLATMESQMKSLETISEDRLKKINELNEKLNEKTKMNKSMAKVVEEYERTIASLIADTEQDKKRHAEERLQLIKERDEQTAHLASMEVSFSDLHSKYEKSKQVILVFKANEDAYKKSIKEFEENLTKMQNNYELLKQHATSKLDHANEELQKINRAHDAEVLKMNAMIKRKELHITSLEETLQQKTKANEELTAICDELINKVG